MDSSFWFDKIILGRSVVYIEVQQVTTFKKNYICFSCVCFFVMANSLDPDEIAHYAAFHLGLHCLRKNSFIGH